MSVGFGKTKADIDARAGSLVADLREALRRAAAFNDLLADTGIFANDQALIDLGYTQTEVDLLQAAFTDLKALYNVSKGSQATGANDFFFNAKKLTGVVI